MSLKDILQSETKVNTIKIKVIANRKENIIVGDSSMIAICSATNNAYENMVEGKCYMILKPIKQDANHFIGNEKLKPVKIADFPLSPKKADIRELLSLMQATPSIKKESQANPTAIVNFKDILELAPKSEIKSIPVKVITISKNIEGCYGPYNIAKIKDSSGEKLDINLYKKEIRKKLERGNVIELKKLKITEYSKDGETFKRLSTTARSTADKCNTITETLFKKVPLGDEKEEGTVVAINDIFPYLSCSKCWKKTDVDDTTCQCGNQDKIDVIDFHCQFYIQIKRDDEVKVVHTFRRTTMLTLASQEEIQKVLEDKYLDKTFSFEWNINTEEDELRMVLITDKDDGQ
jgi:hypothetical protein